MKERPLPDEKKATEYLANERTFLAWVRTSIALISLGFVVAKFSVWMRELVVRIAPNAPTPNVGWSLPIGVTLMIIGGALSVFATWHYHAVNKSIERGTVRANYRLIITVTFTIVVLTIAMIINMLLTAHTI